MNIRHENGRLVWFLRSKAIEKLDLKNQTVAVREALIFQYILENIQIYYDSTSLLAGDYGFSDETESEREAFLNDNSSKNEDVQFAISANEQQLQQDFFCKGVYTPAHTCISYEKVLTCGVRGILEEVAASKQNVSGEQLEYLTAVEIALNSFLKFVDRFVELLQNRNDDRLDKIIDNCKNVPLNPARNFPEAMQSIWLVHMLIGISEYNDASISLGRLDQYAYDCFLQTDEKEAKLWLNSLLDKINSYGDAACTINLGGLDKDSNDLCNDLSYLIARSVKEKLLPSPILAVRIHPDFPQDLFDLLTDPDLFKVGQPTFYGEISCLNALRARAIPEADINKWAANSCMGLLIQGYEVSDMWGCVINCILPLELALNNGVPFNKELSLPLRTKACAHYNSFQDLYNKFLEYLYELIDFCIKANNESTARYTEKFPNPYISAFLNDCIELGKDRVAGGVRYYNVITEAFALVNAADSLNTIKKLVFEQQKYSLVELVDAAKNNFEEHAKLFNIIQSVPKYGDGDSESDNMTAILARDFAARIKTYSNNQKVYAPSLHTLNVHVAAGKLYGASLDGRLNGEPFAKNAGPSSASVSKELTSLMNSAAKIDQSKFFGGQPLDISISTSLIDLTEGKRKFQSLLQTYFKLGGLQIQVNGLTPEMLKKAIDEPAKYKDLIVRIGGYSDYFNRLSEDVRNEMVKRFSNGV